MQEIADEKTLARKVYSSILPKILLGEMEPGSRLSLREISQEHGVSLSVVREAVTRLASEELVEAIPQQGFRIRFTSASDLLDLTWVRAEIESLALRASIERGDLNWECAVVSAHHKLSSTKMKIGGKWNPEWATAHGEFHAALVAACGSPILLRIRQQLYNASEIYRSWSVAAPDVQPRDITAEHREILEAALARDADRAVKVHAHHIRETGRRAVAPQLKQNDPETASLT
jgi:GntR family transcriptional regulator, carbon starvation induced regulator